MANWPTYCVVFLKSYVVIWMTKLQALYLKIVSHVKWSNGSKSSPKSLASNSSSVKSLNSLLQWSLFSDDKMPQSCMFELGNEGFNEDSILDEEKRNSCFSKVGIIVGTVSLHFFYAWFQSKKGHLWRTWIQPWCRRWCWWHQKRSILHGDKTMIIVLVWHLQQQSQPQYSSCSLLLLHSSS